MIALKEEGAKRVWLLAGLVLVLWDFNSYPQVSPLALACEIFLWYNYKKGVEVSCLSGYFLKNFDCHPELDSGSLS